MEIFDALMAGFATAATHANLLWALVGCALCTAGFSLESFPLFPHTVHSRRGNARTHLERWQSG